MAISNFIIDYYLFNNLGSDTYTVRFVPRETGEHLVNVKARRRHIPGSPFKVLVEAPSGGAAACKASGPGLEGGICCQPCSFTVITRDAGPGGRFTFYTIFS